MSKSGIMISGLCCCKIVYFEYYFHVFVRYAQFERVESIVANQRQCAKYIVITYPAQCVHVVILVIIDCTTSLATSGCGYVWSHVVYRGSQACPEV